MEIFDPRIIGYKRDIHPERRQQVTKSYNVPIKGEKPALLNSIARAINRYSQGTLFGFLYNLMDEETLNKIA